MPSCTFCLHVCARLICYLVLHQVIYFFVICSIGESPTIALATSGGSLDKLTTMSFVFLVAFMFLLLVHSM